MEALNDFNKKYRQKSGFYGLFLDFWISFIPYTYLEKQKC